MASVRIRASKARALLVRISLHSLRRQPKIAGRLLHLPALTYRQILIAKSVLNAVCPFLQPFQPDLVLHHLTFTFGVEHGCLDLPTAVVAPLLALQKRVIESGDIVNRKLVTGDATVAHTTKYDG